MTDTLVIYPLAILLSGVLLELLLARFLSSAAKGWLAAACSALSAASTLALLVTVIRRGALDLTLLDWDRGISLVYRADGLSLVFMLMATVIGSAILLYCVRYMQHEPAGVTRFYALMLAFIAGLVQLVTSASLLVAYVSWEIIGLCSYFLVGFWYQQTAAAQGAKKVLVITHLAGYGLLAGILLLYSASGSFLWTDPALQSAFTTGIFLLFLLAAMAKSVVFPLHTWIPEAMNAPTPVSALLHSACYVKAGIYLIARLYSITPWQPAWNVIVMVLGLVTMLAGALFALSQTDLKRLLAFSTISQLGHIVAALALGANLGMAAAIFYTISHGLFKGTLFLCAGVVQHAAGTRDMRRLGGLATRMPWTARIWLIAAAAIIGVPLTNGFVAKWLLLDAALEANQIVVVIVAWVVSVITSIYMLKATVSVFYGDMPAWLRKAEVHDAEPSMLAGLGILGGLCLLFGVAPQILFKSLVAPAINALGFNWEVTLTWFGLQTTSAGIQITLGAGIAIIAILAGVLVFSMTQSKKASAKPAGVFTGGEPLLETAGMTAVDFTELAETNFGPVYKFTDPDRLYMPIWKGIRTLAESLVKLLHPISEKYALAVTILLAVLVFITVWLS